MEVRTLTEFDELPELQNISPDESKYIDAGRKFLSFYERILYKWQNTMSIEKFSDKYIFYFTNHKHWGVAEHESVGLSYAAIEGYLSIKFFAIFQQIFAHKMFDWRNILLESSSNLIADYAVHLFEAMDCARDLHGEKWETLARYHFWKQHKKRFDFEMVRELTDLRNCPIRTPHSKLFTCILPKDVVLTTELKPKTYVSYYGETVQERDTVNALPFYWPPPTNFEAREITSFGTYKSLSHLPSSIRKFFVELSRVLDSCMQIEGGFRKNDVGNYQFYLTLSIRGWEWLSFSQIPEVDTLCETPRVVLRNMEVTMMMKLFDKTVDILKIPDDMIAQVNKGHSSTTKSVAFILSQLLFELRYYQVKSKNPWELPQWHNVITDFWNKEGKYEKKEKILKCSDVSDVIVFKKKELSRNKVAKLIPNFATNEPCEKKEKAFRTQLDTKDNFSLPSSHDSGAVPKTRKMSRNGKTITKRRRGTFSFPARGYVPPVPKALHNDEISIQQAEKTNRILQRKLLAETNHEFAQLVKIFECNKHCYEISVNIRDLLPGKTIVSQNIRSFFCHILSAAKLSLRILKRRYDVENVLYFSLVSNTDANTPTKKCLQETNWVVEKQFSLAPAEVLEKVIDRMLVALVEQGVLMPILYETIHREVPLNLISLIAQPLVVHLQRLLQEGN